MKCDRCGLESDVEQAFSTQKSIGRSRHYCPNCTLKRQTDLFIFDTALLIGSGVLIFTLNPSSRAPTIFLNVSLVVLFTFPLILMHELAHAATAKLTGLRVFSIVIGVGKMIWSGELLGMQWVVNALPLGGITSVGARPVPQIRWRLFLVYLAGPASHIVLALAAYFLLRSLTFSTFGYRVLAALVVSNIVMTVVNLFPRKLSILTGVQGTDGWHLLRVLFLRQDELAKLYVGYFASEAMLAYARNDFETAKGWVEQALVQDRNSIVARNVLGMILMAREDYQLARETFLQLLQTEEGKAPGLHHVLLNNVAYLNALLGDPVLLSEADQYSTEALKHLPWMPAVIGTRGTVLVELGQIEEGIALLTKSMSLTGDKQGKALNACHIALGELRRGDLLTARKYLAIAQALDPKCILIHRVQTKLASLVT